MQEVCRASVLVSGVCPSRAKMSEMDWLSYQGFRLSVGVAPST